VAALDAAATSVNGAELRNHGIAGVPTTRGGFIGRQILMFTWANQTQGGGLCPRVRCAVMGLPDSYKMPDTYKQLLRVAGDGVLCRCALSDEGLLFAPILKRQKLGAVL